MDAHGELIEGLFVVGDSGRRLLKTDRLPGEGAPKYRRAPAGSVADQAEPRIRELLAAYPRCRRR